LKRLEKSGFYVKSQNSWMLWNKSVYFKCYSEQGSPSESFAIQTHYCVPSATITA
jgi:hypothetical protein